MDILEMLHGEQKQQQDDYGRGLHVLDLAAEEIERLRDAGKEAAEMLKQEAAILRDCHTLDGEWGETEPEVKANYDGMIALADRLTPNK